MVLHKCLNKFLIMDFKEPAAVHICPFKILDGQRVLHDYTWKVKYTPKAQPARNINTTM